MRVLFLALGSTRVPTVIEEANEVVARGGSAVVLVTIISTAHFHRFDPKVRIVRVADIVQTVPGPMAWWLLFKGPEVATHAAARGPLRGQVRRVHNAYARRIARMARRGTAFKNTPVEGNPVHQDVFDHVLWHTVLRAETFDLMVVADPMSMPMAQRLVRARRAPTAKKIAFTVDAVEH